MQPPALEIVEPYERWSTGELRMDSSKNIWASEEGEPRNWIKDIQCEISALRVKDIDIDEVFSFLVKMMKKLEFRAGSVNIDSN